MKKTRSSSSWKKLRSSSILEKLRSSSILKKVEVVFHISYSWVKIWLNTKNQLPWLPGTALNVIQPWWWWWFFLTDNNTTSTKVVLSCFGLLVGLWQHVCICSNPYIYTAVVQEVYNQDCSPEVDYVDNCQRLLPNIWTRMRQKVKKNERRCLEGCIN
jgi:hypothetical protein